MVIFHRFFYVYQRISITHPVGESTVTMFHQRAVNWDALSLVVLLSSLEGGTPIGLIGFNGGLMEFTLGKTYKKMWKTQGFLKGK